MLEIISKKKELFGILSIDENIGSILKERINLSELKIEYKEEKDILTINSIKIVLKHKIPSPINFYPDTITMILVVIILEEYNNGYLTLDDNTLNKLVSKLTTS